MLLGQPHLVLKNVLVVLVIEGQVFMRQGERRQSS